jgi:hypothetical protein
MSAWTFDQDDEGQLFATHRHEDATAPVNAEILTRGDGGTRYAHCPDCGEDHAIERDGGDVAEVR